ncbi:LacI family DNA-binding transcriptional regulator [Calderihabitans maritimus]|uniref:LacI family transcriptional regulator n=1 Tax=Calderihabitans maritimus TaxID=1246530 RepID=A0A1Z5HS69_9FIRM|nr:LacI family DNA-binding transcriptional regulator [Calderihabitans maritimus]GAW92364.1 LacI family transcriptional regulator [Calderihabitans maritimus]
MTVTIKDIAKRAGVSYSTVSRALNNRPEVNEKTRREIQKLAEEMGYRPNAIARGLVTQKTGTLGLVIPDITNPFFPEVARGAEEEADRRGYNVFLCNTAWDLEKEQRYLEALVSKRVDGIILSSASEDSEYVARLARSGPPLILINRVLKQVNTNYVVIDNIRGAYMVVEHLLDLGHRRIAYIGGPEKLEPSRERFEGYRLALAARGVDIDPLLVRYGKFKKEDGYRNACVLLEDPALRPTAIFAANDILALGVIQAARDLGLQVPEQLSVVGFDDIPFVSYGEIRLTTVAQPKYAMGEMAAKILLDEIQNASKQQKKHVVLQPELVIRNSSGPPLQ